MRYSFTNNILHVNTILNRTYIVINSTYISMPRLYLNCVTWRLPQSCAAKIITCFGCLHLPLVGWFDAQLLDSGSFSGCCFLRYLDVAEASYDGTSQKRGDGNWWIFPFVKNLSTCESQHPSDLYSRSMVLNEYVWKPLRILLQDVGFLPKYLTFFAKWANAVQPKPRRLDAMSSGSSSCRCDALMAPSPVSHTNRVKEKILCYICILQTCIFV